MTVPEPEIHIVALLGSVRPGSFTCKALKIALEALATERGVSTELIDPRDLRLPLPGIEDPDSNAEWLQERVRAATGVLVSTPEYHGSYSSTIKLVIDNLGFPSTLSGKPVSLLGVADGRIGAVKALEHLRSVCSHVGAIVLPGPVSVAGVQNCFDRNGRCVDHAVEAYIHTAAMRLVTYIRDHVCPRIALEEMVRRGEAADEVASVERTL